MNQDSQGFIVGISMVVKAVVKDCHNCSTQCCSLILDNVLMNWRACEEIKLQKLSCFSPFFNNFGLGIFSPGCVCLT